MKKADQRKPIPGWVPLTSSIAFIFGHIRILGWSVLLVAVTGLLTWAGYIGSFDFISGLTGHYFQHHQVSSGIVGFVLGRGRQVLYFLFLLVIRIASFYLAFLVAYCLTSPGYVFLSTATEKIILGEAYSLDEGLNFKGIIIDIIEGCKIGAVGLLVTIVALLVNFIPLIGQGAVLLIYIFYSALMFVDYPASRTRWSLGQKIRWVRTYYRRSFRLGIFPAVVSMIPVVNIFFMALLFPLFTVHTTLNFIAIERRR